MGDRFDSFNPEEFRPDKVQPAAMPLQPDEAEDVGELSTDDLREHVIGMIRGAQDSEEMREALSEAGPLTLALLAEVALVGSAQIADDMRSGKLKGHARAVNVGIAVDKMGRGADLLKSFAPTKIIFQCFVPFPMPWGPGDTSGWDTDEPMSKDFYDAVRVAEWIEEPRVPTPAEREHNSGEAEAAP